MKLRIEWTYKTPKGNEAVFLSDEMPAAQALLLVEDMERTGRVKTVAFHDRFDSTWTVKELRNYLKGIETEPHNVEVYFDGGFDKATKQAGLGCVIYYEQNGKMYRLRQNAAVDDLLSNNEAEYASFFLSLQELEVLGVHDLPVRFIGDSKVVINGLGGEWPVMEKELSRWADRIEEKMSKSGIQPEYELVSRKRNAEADRLATQALNGIDITGTMELEK
ncbi:ribonuclease H family protein [Planococcus salinus]|uniref:Reverse transcriptase-like protein n=1 Tax=Planococcus salinus TaxID=1848460 RepID=A0A3M8P5S4_9BACL|nr:ribonuclease H family protein [Planococcus salinus]RNF39033.1 reverse transcriptase-like protein [Planococcus salinus]